MKATKDDVRAEGQFSLSWTGETGAACGVRLSTPARAATVGPGPSPCLTGLLPPHFWVCVSGCAHFVLQFRQTEKSEERLINQQIQSKVNKKRWHHVGWWERLFSGAPGRGESSKSRYNSHSTDNKFPLAISPQQRWSNQYYLQNQTLAAPTNLAVLKP